jgi:hypothetical protein
MMAMADERAQLEECDRHIALTRRHVTMQEQIIRRLGAKGETTDDAEKLLDALHITLSDFEQHRRLLLGRLS